MYSASAEAHNNENTDVPGTGGYGSVALLPSGMARKILETTEDVDVTGFHLLPPPPEES
jgi:hypothetical protein